jgi:short-subunit dehydrogenase
VHTELADQGIRTVAIAPGLTVTAFLCSDAASHLSGTVIMVRPPVNR